MLIDRQAAWNSNCSGAAGCYKNHVVLVVGCSLEVPWMVRLSTSVADLMVHHLLPYPVVHSPWACRPEAHLISGYCKNLGNYLLVVLCYRNCFVQSVVAFLKVGWHFYHSNCYCTYFG